MAVGESVVDALKPVQERFHQLMNDRAFLETTWRDGAQKADYIARRTLSKVMKKIGFIY
jgi:tryptophanyl-tRNA synthetase